MKEFLTAERRTGGLEQGLDAEMGTAQRRTGDMPARKQQRVERQKNNKMVPREKCTPKPMKGEKHMNTLFMTAEEVAKEMNVSKAYAYKVIQRLNTELSEMGYYTVSGKVNRKYFMKKVDSDEGKEKK